MKLISSLGTLVSVLLLGAFCGSAEEDPASVASAAAIEPPKSDSPNRFSLAWRTTFNINLSFRNVGGFGSATDPGPAVGGNYNRAYDDGFNKVDITGNNHGAGYANTTWYWGYDSESQILPSMSNPQSVVMHSSSASGTSTSHDDTEGPGVEFGYSRELLRKEGWRAGLEGIFGYTDLTVEDNAALSTSVSQIADSFAVPYSSSGQFLPPPGRTATAQGPAAVISSSPIRTTSTTLGQTSGSRNFRADLFGFRFGPYVELPIGKKGAFDLSGGFALMYVESDFRFNESTAVSGFGSFGNVGWGSHNGWLAGGYVAGGFSYAINQNWGAFAGAQFQDVGRYTHEEGGHQAVLDLTRAVFVTLGFSYSF